MPKYMSQASKKDRYKASRDYLKLKTQQSTLPRLDKVKYQPRKGLEGPFMTKAGQVVYYDRIHGDYYNPDTDMYISYDDWKKLSEESIDELFKLPKQGSKVAKKLFGKIIRGRIASVDTTATRTAYKIDWEDKTSSWVHKPDIGLAPHQRDVDYIVTEDVPANATGTSVAGTGDDSSTVVVKKKKKLQDKLMRRLKIKEAIDRAIPDLEYPKDEITERKQQLIDLARKYGENI